jgi:Ribonuclease G/E
VAKICPCCQNEGSVQTMPVNAENLDEMTFHECPLCLGRGYGPRFPVKTMLYLRACEREAARLRKQEARVREALDGFEYELDCGAGIYRKASAFELRAAIRAALDPHADPEVPDE